jgi:hypothetical protein
MDSQGASSDADRSAVIFREVTAESRKDLEALALARITWGLADGRARRGPRRGTCAALGDRDDGKRDVVEDVVPADDAQKLVEWLTLSWHPIQRALEEWTVADLRITYEHRWRGETYAV